MKTTKNAYLAKLTEQIQMKPVKVGKNLEGTTPPSVFGLSGRLDRSKQDPG